MATRIRLARGGRKKRPFYRIVVADSRAPRDGRFIERIGRYDPLLAENKVIVDVERATHWLDVGALPSERVSKLLALQGIEHKLVVVPERKAPPAQAAEEPAAPAKGGKAAKAEAKPEEAAAKAAEADEKKAAKAKAKPEDPAAEAAEGGAETGGKNKGARAETKAEEAPAEPAEEDAVDAPAEPGS